MKNYLVIGNPIEHSLSPKLHNYWIKENNIDAAYNKRQLDENDIKGTINEVADGKIDGINVTVPFKKSVIPFLNELTPLAKEAQSVNTIYKKDGKVVGDNTDVDGFGHALKHIDYNVQGKKVFILGAGGVVSSIILALKKAGASEIVLSNRTKEKAENLKKKYSYLKVVDWGDIPDSNMIINATSLGLKEDDEIKLNYADIRPNKLFYDIIYNPSETKFLSKAKQFGNQIENGKAMFVYQAQLAFEIWHNIKPTVDKKILKLLDND
jgi:shikimate dehydrogenase